MGNLDLFLNGGVNDNEGYVKILVPLLNDVPGDNMGCVESVPTCHAQHPLEGAWRRHFTGRQERGDVLGGNCACWDSG